MKLFVGDKRIAAEDKQEALRIAVDILRCGSMNDRVVLRTPDKGIYGWVQYCVGAVDKRKYLVCFTKASNVGRTIILPEFKLGWGIRWTKPRENSQKR